MENTCRYHYQNHDMIYNCSDNRATQTQIDNFSSYLPFTPLKQWKWKCRKMKKIAAGIIILHMGTKNHNHMMYGSWDTEQHRQKFLSFLAIFRPFTSPQMILNTKILKNKQTKKYDTGIPDERIFFGKVCYGSSSGKNVSAEKICLYARIYFSRRVFAVNKKYHGKRANVFKPYMAYGNKVI